MGGNALTLMEYLDRPRGEPDPDLLTQQVVRSRVIVFADLVVSREWWKISGDVLRAV